ncbi:MAG: hypothetical protein DRQ13_06630 [Ignavibacteriae bacterium]|nr:MAG: hypothetical protein DRQ13_06630 [Ignavibacteriota bacterium]
MQSVITLLIVLFLSITIYSQQNKYFDAPFGGGLGYVPGWYIPNLDPVNSEMGTIGMPELSTSGFYSSGIAGFIYIGFVKHLRVGGMGFSGSTSSTQEVGNENREVVYKLGGGGLTIEYTLPIVKDIGISVGATIGAGTMTVNVFSNNGDFNWENIWQNLENADSSSMNTVMDNSFWMFTPTLNLDWPVSRFVVLRLGVGYQLTFGDKWTADNNQPLQGVPSGLSGNAFFIQSGIFIGFFAF